MSLSMNYWAIASIVVALIAVTTSVMGFLGKNKFAVNGKTILLTGASEGMGKSVAKQLAAKGANVIIVSRSLAKLEAAMDEVKASASAPSTQRFHYISADLSAPDSSPDVLKQARTWNNGRDPDIVWCIAGSSYPSLYIETPISKLRSQMDINYWAAADMAHAVLSSWLSPESESKGTERHFIFTSSVIAFYPIAGYAPYAPAKAAMRNLSDTLAQEVLLYGDDVKIHTVFPGTILTPSLENENITKPEITFVLEETDPEQTPDEVARKAIKGLENGEYLITVNWLGAAMRGCAWGGSSRNNWVIDTVMTWITSIAWIFVGKDLDGKVRKFGREKGHPSTYVKSK